MKKVKVKSPFSRLKAHQNDIHKPMIKPPKLLRTTPKLTVRQLLAAVDEKKREASKEIAIKTMRTIAVPKSGKIIPADTPAYRIQTYSKHNRHIHNVSVFIVDKQPFSADSKCIIDCSCSSHIFHSEFNLAKRGNAFLWRCNGQAPTTYIGLTICKHCYVALRYMVRKSKYGALPKKSRYQKKLSFAQGT